MSNSVNVKVIKDQFINKLLVMEKYVRVVRADGSKSIDRDKTSEDQ